MSSSKLFLNEECVVEYLGEESIVLQISTGRYHHLNYIGSKILNEVKLSNPTRSELIQGLERQYKSAEINFDVNEFLDDLIERNIVLQRWVAFS